MLLIKSSTNTHCCWLKPRYSFFLRFYLFTFREWGRREKEGEKHSCVVAFYWGPCLQPRHVPWLGIEPETLGFSGQCSVHWVTPARVQTKILWAVFLSFIPRTVPHPDWSVVINSIMSPSGLLVCELEAFVAFPLILTPNQMSFTHGQRGGRHLVTTLSESVCAICITWPLPVPRCHTVSLFTTPGASPAARLLAI